METAHDHPEVGHVFRDNPQLFSKEHDDFEQLTLTLFIMYEY